MNDFSGYMSPEYLQGVWSHLAPILLGILLLVLTYFVADLVRKALQKLLSKSRLDANLTRLTKSSEPVHVAEPITSIGYYGVWLLALPLILEKFGFTSLTAPINSMISEIASFFPKLLSALIIFAVFYFVANALRVVIVQVLEGLGLNRLMKNIGLDTVVKTVQPAKLVGTVAFIMTLLIGATQAIQTLGLPMLTDIMNTVLNISGSVLFGSIIIVAGIFGANIVADLISEHGGSKQVAQLAKVVIMIFVTLTGIQQMGIQTSIITNGAQFAMAAIALGFALAMGLGAKDTIGKYVSDLIAKFK